jgi:transcription elongation factor GreB
LPLPAGARNYMTPGGFQRMKDELDHLVQKERPELVATVSWAAGNGDRSENGDYIYGKKRLREIDRRIRFLSGASIARKSSIRRRVATTMAPIACIRRDRVTVVDQQGAEAAPSASSAIDEIDTRAATSAGSRRWRVRC